MQKIKKQLEDSSVTFVFCTCTATVLNILFVLIAFFNFLMSYVFSKNDLLNFVSEGAFSFDRKTFFVDFYVFTIIFVLCMLILLWQERNFFVGVVLEIAMLVSSNLCLYTVNEIFTIKIFFFIAWIITVAIKFEMKFSIPLLTLGILIIVVIQFFPNLIGIVDFTFPQNVEQKESVKIIQLLLYLFLIAFIALLYRFVVYKWQKSIQIQKHLNLVMSQMTKINSHLQDFARTKSKQAAEEERLRITRDMHDSCGYVFVNIMSLMDACASSKPMSWEKTKETFETVHYLAKNGLQDTRKTLRAIRDIQDPKETNLDSLNEIRNIFQKVTGVEIVLDKGNMKESYGNTINKILIRAMQEGLTNSIRHGRATSIIIYFREDNNILFMTIQDNGIGASEIVKGIGLSGMEERIKKLGGKLTTSSNQYKWFKTELEIPILNLLSSEGE